MADFSYSLLGKASASGAIGTYSTLVTAAAPIILAKVIAVNKDAAAQTIRIALGSQTITPAATEWDVYGYSLQPGETLEIGHGCTIDATNKFIMVSASDADVNFKAYGTIYS
jgi:hypothetical protein